MWVVFVIEMNLLLPCFGLLTMYIPWYKPTPEPERHGPASLHRCTQSMFLYCMVIVGSILNKDAPSPPLFLFKYSAQF